MTVYVGLGIADKPRVQHLAKPIRDRWDLGQLSWCRVYVLDAEEHDRQRMKWINSGHRKSTATPIDYDALPMCKRCQKASTR